MRRRKPLQGSGNAHALFVSCGITVQLVLTDNGSCYRSHDFKQALSTPIVHHRTRQYHPQTNGKVERYNHILLEEWTYAQPYTSETQCVKAFADWIHHYNYYRAQTALKGQPPPTRITNLPGQVHLGGCRSGVGGA